MEFAKTLKDNNKNAVAFGIKKIEVDQAPTWFREFANKVEAFMIDQKKFNSFVLEQFQKHKWIKK